MCNSFTNSAKILGFAISTDSCLQESRPQDEGKAKVRELVEQFKKNCMKKITTKSLDPAKFKQGIAIHYSYHIRF